MWQKLVRWWNAAPNSTVEDFDEAYEDFQVEVSELENQITKLQGQVDLQELLLKDMLEEVNYYKKQHQLCEERIKRSYKQVLR